MSWNLPSGDDFLPRVSEAKLEKLYRQEMQARPKLRLLCALHRKKEMSMDQIANLLHMSRYTVHKYLWRFEEKGLAAKDTIKQPGRKPSLSPLQRRQLVRELEKGPPYNRGGLWDTKQVRELIYKKFGVRFVSQHAWRILKACGFSIQRARPRHYKTASKEEIAAFKKKPNDSSSITEKRVLSWPLKMRPRLASSRSLQEDGQKKEATQS